MEVGGEGDYIPIATLPMSVARPFLSLESGYRTCHTVNLWEGAGG